MTDKLQTAYKQDNELIEACYQLPLNAKRLVVLALSRIDSRAMPQNNLYTISATEWKKYFPSEQPWRDLQRAAKQLLRATVTFPQRGEGDDEHNWAETCQYRPKAGLVRIRFTRVMETYLTNLFDMGYTKVNLVDIGGMQSAYSIRLYELLSRYRDTGWRQIEVVQLRDILAIDQKYRAFYELKRNVIDPGVHEINELTSLVVKWEPIKQGRRTQAIKFTFHDRRQQEITPIKERRESSFLGGQQTLQQEV